ncbi:U-box domain-containing protein 3 isoform X1 [Ziziphus jujuba]|uniref:RING-type E3 ubiquitin transferase n=1 Tax=Ziziphus jujuba TaxID=326968 RepID=A0ABM3IWZ9_ZIZJJ|nr:U-box domain-containing protein 3 isoform X1 [Ziziphus jujuba]XP_048337154.2 U-box domain-containing protein 3 isoform X1 [Ziziphus jujuba]
MDTSMKCLINSIHRFIHLVSCQTIKPMPIQKHYRTVAGVLKLLKPVLDEVVDYKIQSDEVLYKECGELDIAVNEGREFMEKWSPKRSKISTVLRSELLLMKIQSSSLKLCYIICRLLHSSSSNSNLTGIQHCMQEIQCLKQERITEYIEGAMRSQRNNALPGTKDLMKIIELLGLTSQELLKESIAVEKERMNAEVREVKEHLEEFNQIVDLVSHIRDYIIKIDHFEASTGTVIPPYFCCPLSSELMLDPVILASGQTYERSSIQKWLDHGLTICPKTRQILTHTNLIPNYTVKAMIASWCEENHVKLPVNPDCTTAVSVPSLPCHVPSQVPVCTDSFRCSMLSSNSTSRSSLEVGNIISCGEKSNGCHSREKSHMSPEHSYLHSRSESTSSALSSIDYVPPASIEVSGVPTKPEIVNELNGEITSECFPALPNKESNISPWLLGKQLHISKTKAEVGRNGHLNDLKESFSSLNSLSEELTTASHVKKLVENLRSHSKEVQTTAAEELRLLSKHNVENRIVIGQSGAITPLLALLYSETKLTQEHAVTALLNLSINKDNKAMIAEAGAIEPLIHVLKTGNDGAKENSAAALFSISVLEEYKAKIGRSGAVKALVDLLGSGTFRGKKDAATALFNLSIFHENKARMVQAGAVKYLVELMDPNTGMVDKAVALLANLSTIGEGRLALVRQGGIPLLVEIVETGSQRGKENAASILLQLCLHSPKFCTLILQEGAVPPLVALSQSGTTRAKEKAQQLLSHFRNQREGATGKGKS